MNVELLSNQIQLICAFHAFEQKSISLKESQNKSFCIFAKDVKGNVLQNLTSTNNEFNRYQQLQGQWIAAALESRELLSLCLKKLKGLNKVLRLTLKYYNS